jgi:hypothetical protein
MWTTCRYLWASPTTAVGLLITAIALPTGGRARVVAGVLEVHGGFATTFLRAMFVLPGGAAAVTLGHVVLGRDQRCLDITRDHERVHVRQAERWGPMFLPAYAVASVFAKLRGKDPYRDNCFERQAYGTTTIARSI